MNLDSVELVEGWTGVIDMQLFADGIPVNLTGCTIALVLRGKDGSLVDTTTNIAVLDVTQGKVRYSPDATDLLAAKSPYSGRWKVTDTTSKIVFFPSGVWQEWIVRS